ncbi:MAG: hypothetical protein ACREJD_06700 [Phycisphaerales bacterium]
MTANGFNVTSHTHLTSLSHNGTWGSSSANSLMSVRYTLDSSAQYQFTSLKFMSPGGFRLYIKNLATNTFTYLNEHVPDGNFSVTNTLLSGSYEIGISVTDAGGGGNNHSSDPVASFAFIPSPSAGMVFSSGLMLLARRRRA